jgi:HK97 family phage major capsid protein/HK97 family phage prohead protease
MTRQKSRGFTPTTKLRLLPLEVVQGLEDAEPSYWREGAAEALERHLEAPTEEYSQFLRQKWQACRDYNTPQGYLYLASWGLVADCGEEEQLRAIQEYLGEPVEFPEERSVKETAEIHQTVLGRQQRAATITSGTVNLERRTVDLTFSSESPVERGYWEPYDEVLGHDASEANLERLNDGGAFLWAHDWDDQRGVVEKAEIKNGRGYARVRLSKNPAGDELLTDIEDGIIRNVSFGYITKEAILVKKGEGGKNTYRIIDWEALEISSVSVPADPTVGVGRELAPKKELIQVREEPRMAVDIRKEVEQIDAANEQHIAAIREAERKRIALINKFAERCGTPREKVEEFINRGISVEDACSEMADAPDSKILREQPNVNMTKREMSQYSLSRVLRAVTFNDPTILKIEREIHEEISKKSGISSDGGYFIPELPHLNRAYYARNQNITTPAAGGNLVPTEYMPSEYIDLLRMRTIGLALGIRMMPGMVGNPKFPRKLSKGAPGAIAEQALYPTAALTFDLVGMVPKKYGMIYRYTEEMIQQGVPSIDSLIYDDLVDGMAEEFDRLLFYGNGTTEPIGLANVVGINTINSTATNVDAPNGGAPTWEQIVRFQTLCATQNALSRTARYVSNAAVMGKLKTTTKGANTTGIYLMPETFLDDGFGILNGHPFGWSNVIRSDRTKGTGTNLSDLFYGDWGQWLCAEWQGMEIKRADQDSDDFQRDIYKIKVSRRIDNLCRYPKAFGASTDLITA